MASAAPACAGRVAMLELVGTELGDVGRKFGILVAELLRAGCA